MWELFNHVKYSYLLFAALVIIGIAAH